MSERPPERPLEGLSESRLRRAALALFRFETWLTLLAAPPLVFRERFSLALQLAALAWLALLWLARRLTTGAWTRRTVLDAPVLALLATLPGAIAVSQLPQASISRVLSLIFALALAYALANFMRSPRQVWLVCTWLLWAGLALVALGLVSIDWLDKFAAIGALLRGLPRLFGAVTHPTLPEYGPAEGVGVHPNSVAALLTLVVPLAAALLIFAGPADASSPQAPPRWIRPLALVSLLVCGGMLVLTQSRGAWLATLAALIAMVASRHVALFRAAVITGLAGAAAVLVIGPTAVMARLLAAGVPLGPLPGRVALWREAAALLAARPLTGIGLNTFLVVHGQRPEYAGGFVYQGFPHAHNQLLQAALDYGLPGLVAVLGLFVALAIAARQARRRLCGRPLEAVVLGLGFGLLAFALHGLVDSVSIGSKIGFVPWAYAGALAGLRAGAGRWAAVPIPGRPEVPYASITSDPVSPTPIAGAERR